MFLEATLTNGEKRVSQFSKLGNATRYANQVFMRQKAFNGWRIVATQHPHSGEAVLYRTREMISGEHVLAITEVKPKPGFEETHNLDPRNFEPVPQMQRGERGAWKAPLDRPVVVEDVTTVAGAEYPIHRDPASYRDYVILRAATESPVDGVPGTREVRYYLDGRGTEPGVRFGMAYDAGSEEEEGSAWADVDDEAEEGDY